MKNATINALTFSCAAVCCLILVCSCVSPEVVIPKCEMVIVHSYPSNGATGVTVDSEALVVFSKEVATDVVQSHVYVDRSLNGTWVAEPLTYTYELKDNGFYVQMINQQGTWMAGTKYRLVVNAGNGIPSKDGSCVLNEGITVEFTTAP